MNVDNVLKNDLEYIESFESVSYYDLEISNIVSLLFIGKFIRGSVYKKDCIKYVLSDEYFKKCIEKYKEVEDLVF